MPVFLMSLLGGAGAVGKGIVAWLSRRSLSELAVVALIIAILVDHSALLLAHRHGRKLETQLAKCDEARKSDQAAYAKAQADAAENNREEVRKVAEKQQKVTNDVEAQYRADLARLERVRTNAQAAQRPPVKPSPPIASQASSGPCNQTVPLSGPELLQARQTELQLNALIDWVNEQSAINPNDQREPSH